jgi:transcriptional regulator with XRE-family HTH domain
MRGAGDELTKGERIAFYRRRRGLTKKTLGALANRSEEWASSIERGRRPIRRIDVLIPVATALRVGLPDLLGQPVLMEDDDHDDDIPAVRDALMAPRRLSKLLYRAEDASPPPDPSATPGS